MVFSGLQLQQPLVSHITTSPWCSSISLHIPADFTSLSCCTFLYPRATFFESLLAWRCLEMRIWRILHFVKENKVLHFNTMMHCSARFSATLLGRAGNHVGQYSSRVVPVDCYVAGAVWLCSAQDFCCCLQICNQPPACVFYSWVDRYSPPLEHIRTFCVFIYCKSIIYTYIDLFQGA